MGWPGSGWLLHRCSSTAQPANLLLSAYGRLVVAFGDGAACSAMNTVQAEQLLMPLASQASTADVLHASPDVEALILPNPFELTSCMGVALKLWAYCRAAGACHGILLRMIFHLA